MMRIRGKIVTLATVAALTLVTNISPISSFQKALPLVSPAYAQEKIVVGDGMGNGVQKKIDEKKLEKDVATLADIKRAVDAGQKLTPTQADDLIRIRNTWWPERPGMNGTQQTQIFGALMEIIGKAKKQDLLPKEKEDDLIKAGLLTRPKTIETVVGEETRAIEVKLPRFTPLITKRIDWVFPEIDPSSALIQGVDNKAFVKAAGEGLLSSFGGPGNPVTSGKAMADMLFSGSFNEQVSRLGLRGAQCGKISQCGDASAEAMMNKIESLLRQGKILEAMGVDSSSNFSQSMYANLQKVFDKIEINLPVFTTTVGVSARVLENAKFYLDIAAVIHILTMKEYKPVLSQGAGGKYTLSLNSTGELNTGLIIAPDIAGGWKPFKGAELEIGFTPTTLIGKVGQQGTFVGQFRVSWKDESGNLHIGNVPLVYGAAVVVGTDKSLQLKTNLGAGLGSVGGIGFAAFVDLEWLALQGKIPQQPLVLRPGLQLDIHGHRLNGYALLGPGGDTSTYGGGLGFVLKQGLIAQGSLFHIKRKGVVEEQGGLGGTVGLEYRFK